MPETKSYGTTEIPGDTVTVTSGGTVSISRGFNATAGLVGNMDVEAVSGTENGAEPGTVVNPTSIGEAEQMFGEGSELAQQVRFCYQNGAADVLAVGLQETEHTESFSDSTSGTFEASPVDPTVLSEHEITVQDTTAGATVDGVKIVYDGGDSAPETGVAIDPTTDSWVAASSSSYDFTFDSANFSDAIEKVGRRNVRFVGVMSEKEGHAQDTLSVTNIRAEQFDFKRGLSGTDPEVSPPDYDDGISDQRHCLVSTPRAYTEEGEQGEVRTMGAVTGLLTGKTLGDSATYEAVDGFVSLRNSMSPSALATMIDVQTMPLQEQQSQIVVVKDMTTSTDVRFERVFQCEIADEAAALSHEVCQQFIGRLNIERERENLKRSHNVIFYNMEQDNQLDDYSVETVEAADDTVDVNVGLDIVDVIDRINVNISVGDVITYAGNGEGQ